MALLNYAFNTLNLRKVCSSVLAFNKRSLHYQLNQGYKIVGKRRHQVFKNGKYYNEILLELFKKDWQKIWEEYNEEGDPPGGFKH
jgi:RimJ/RimL family protein N-acetyltransferase